MKLLLSALCASFMIAPAFAEDCEKGKCDKEKQGTVIACDKSGKCDGEKKAEGTLIAGDCDKCKKGDEKKTEGTLIAGDCGKCKKDGEEKKTEGTLLAGDCDKCKKDCDEKKEGTLA